MITIPAYLEIAQWALLVALAMLVVAAFRQIGRLVSGQSAPAELGPPVGSSAAPLGYARPGDEAVREFTPGDGQPALLAFADPTCPSCEELVGVLGSLRDAGELDGFRVLVLISDPPSYLQISEVFSSTGIEVGRPVRRDGLDYYRASATPVLVAIDGAGVVRAAGSAVREPQVRAFAQACLLPPPAAELAIAAGRRAVQPEAKGEHVP